MLDGITLQLAQDSDSCIDVFGQGFLCQIMKIDKKYVCDVGGPTVQFVLVNRDDMLEFERCKITRNPGGTSCTDR